MFGTIRKHQTWLWVIIITLTVISFVVFFSPYSRVNNDSRSGRYGVVDGHRVTEEGYGNAQREVYLRYFFSSGKWPDDDARKSGFDPLRETYQWLLLVNKQEQYGVSVGPDVAARFALEMLRPLERMGVTSPDIFFKQVLQPRGFKVDDFERFVRHYLGIQELISSVGMSGKLVTPDEAKGLYIRERQEISASAVVFSLSNYLSKVTVTPDSLIQFYSNRLSNYRVPDRVQVNYVKFNVTNYTSAAEAELSKTNLTEMVEANSRRLGTNYYGDAKSPEESKAKIREEIIRSRALMMARKQGAEFASPLFDLQPVRLDNLEKLAKEKGLTVASSKPFDREEGPTDLEVGPDFAKVAFSRTDDEPFSTPVVGMDGVYVFAVTKRIPSEIPSFETVKDKVTADYRHAQAASLARMAGQMFHPQLTNGLAQSKSFEALCKDGQVKPIELPPFSLSSRALGEVEEKLNLNQVKQLAFSTEPGKASAFQMTADGGLIVFVKAKLPINDEKMKTDFPAFLSYVRQTRQNEAFNDWFRKEADRGLRDTPLAQPQQDPAQAKKTATPTPPTPPAKKS
ncbi:MAG: peptidyl-prolyl cis-trans isomerase [Verrucomicrobia bacterium]|nr:peptidyl-prolyl cis-trans isomerase [Verrucomicrobiota bacterium]